MHSSFAIISKLSQQNKIRKIISFPLINNTTVLNISNDRERNNMKNTNTLKCYSSDEPARGFLVGDECRSHCFIVLSKRDFNFKLKLVSNDDW